MSERDRSHHEPERDGRTGQAAAAARIQQHAQWVELQIKQAMERGEFEDLPGFGKPIEGLGPEHDPDWWLKKLVEREHIAVLPPALQIRKDDAELDAALDRLASEQEVRNEVEEFNERVRRALYQPTGGPPMITRQRDVEHEVEAWHARRRERVEQQRQALQADEQSGTRRRWWRRR